MEEENILFNIFMLFLKSIKKIFLYLRIFFLNGYNVLFYIL